MQMAVIHFLLNRMKNITNIPLSNIKTKHLPNNRKYCLKFDYVFINGIKLKLFFVTDSDLPASPGFSPNP